MNFPDTSSEGLRTFRPHQRVHGTVTRLTADSAFVDVDGVVGGICAEIGRVWTGRGSYPWPFEVGYQGQFWVLDIDHQKNRLWLEYISPESLAIWDAAARRFPPLSRHQAEVVAVLSSKIAVSLDRGVTAWLPLSEIQRHGGAAQPTDLFSVGDTIEIVVLEVDLDRMDMLVGPA